MTVTQAAVTLDLDALLVGIPPTAPWSGLLTVGDARFGLVSEDGRSTRVTEPQGINDSWDFELVIDHGMWQTFCATPRVRGYTTAQALVATSEGAIVRGSRDVWARVAPVLDRVVDAVRPHHLGAPPHRTADPRTASRSPIRGGYLDVDVAGESQRIYYEVSGTGPPLLCLHTAGADSRQFRYLLEDADLGSRWTVVAFDMPWHGRSEPPTGWHERAYRLTTERYAATILAVSAALELDRPVLLGCSMGGAICLYMASRHPDRFRGVCALEGGLGNPSRFVDWTNRLDVDHSHFLTSWVGGLIAPTSPAAPSAQTLWGYAQSGPGVYQGDTYFYSEDFPRHSAGLAPAGCPLFVFSGEYDYSASLEMSREAATRLGGELVEMKTKGHFPMAEDPVGFAEYLTPVLARIAEMDRTRT